jgi:isopentenyl diphosphate isomerase/L-lactate dehydrogenase-like FMN-dependent dehydrogenase
VDVSRVTTETAPMPSVGVHAPLAAPILVAPVAMQKMAHPDGEIGAALACAEARLPYCASQQSTTRVEHVGEAIAGASGAMWFQLYVLRDRAAVEALVRRAERSGATALVVTVDAPTLGRRERDVRNKFALAGGLRLANVDVQVPESKSESESESGSESSAPSSSAPSSSAPSSSAPSSSAPSPPSSSAAASTLRQASISRRIGGRDDSLTWRDVRRLRSVTSLPVILKGVLTPEDARRAVASGAAAVWVSNHGGRQLDGAPATLEALPGVAGGVSGRVPIIFDGGVRRGADALKAIALGADLVAVGKPAAFGLACAGRAGVEAALGMLAEELRTAMALAGVRDVEEAKDRRLVATPADRWGEFGGGGKLRRWKRTGTRGKAPRAKM